MTIIQIAAVLVACLITPTQANECLRQKFTPPTHGQVAGWQENLVGPRKTGSSMDVILSAHSALVWDQTTGTILYEKNAHDKRPVASLSKLLSALVIRKNLSLKQTVTIPPAVINTQKKGKNIKLPVGDKATVYDLLSAGLITSANDAMVALAVSLSDDEDGFARQANKFAAKNGAFSTRVSNATGLTGGEQYSTAYDLKEIFSLAYRDKVIRDILASANGKLVTSSGVVRRYNSTNALLGTYFPVLAAKTGYTPKAGENLIVMTYGAKGQRIGAVVLGSQSRFKDMKVLVEWIWRNYTWP